MQREVAARAACAARRRTATPRACRGPALSPEPAFGIERAGLGKVLRAHAVVAHRAPQQRACRHLHVAQLGVAQGFAHQERRHRLQAHRLVQAGLDVVELRQVFRRQRLGLVGHAHRTSSRARAITAGWRCSRCSSQARVLAVVSSPASSMVSTLADTCSSPMPRAALVGGDDHRLQQVRRLLAARRVGAQALARLGDESRQSPASPWPRCGRARGRRAA